MSPRLPRLVIVCRQATLIGCGIPHLGRLPNIVNRDGLPLWCSFTCYWYSFINFAIFLGAIQDQKAKYVEW